MIDVRFVPLKEWPGKPTVGRINGRFRVSYAKTLDLLEEELKKLRAKNILIQAWFTMQQLRNDGWPYANAVPSGPGVVLSFDTSKGSLSFPCDTYLTYDDNLRAIGLALQALRAVDRYGVTKQGEQYRGWKRIAPPSDNPFGTKEDAAKYVLTQTFGQNGWPAVEVGAMIEDAGMRDRRYKIAAAQIHPDKPNGSHELFVRLQAAMKMLEGK